MTLSLYTYKVIAWLAQLPEDADVMRGKDVDGEDVVQVEALDEEPVEHRRPGHGYHKFWLWQQFLKADHFLLVQKVLFQIQNSLAFRNWGKWNQDLAYSSKT